VMQQTAHIPLNGFPSLFYHLMRKNEKFLKILPCALCVCVVCV
jgi:hypothetical protein